MLSPRRLLPVLAIAIALLVSCTGGEELSVSSGPSPSQSLSPKPTPRATPTPTAAPTPAPTPTAEPTLAPTPEPTPPPPPPPPPPPAPPPPPPILEPYVLPPSEGGPAQVISRGNPGRMAVALSFDAGSDAGYAGMILDVLAANGIRASFGMTGRWAEQNPGLVQRMVGEGHHLINHTYDHASMTGASTRTRALTREERWWQLDRTEEIIVGLTGATTKPFFRPPYGAHDASVNEDVGARGYAYNVMWTVDSRGWLGWSAGAITQRCLQLAAPGAIYVFHVGASSQDGPALQGIIDGLRAAGYAIGTVPDVMAP